MTGSHKGMVVWFTGLPAAGKSTISAGVQQRLSARGVRARLLDGDALRRTLSRDLGYTLEDRGLHVQRVATMADLLSRRGAIVLVAVVSPLRAHRERARATVGARFVEVHVDAPVETCIVRDPKGLYREALAGQRVDFTGVSSPYEAPLRPDLRLDTDRLTPDQAIDEVLAWLDANVTAQTGAARAAGERP